jgi:hypothetical protein
VEFIELPAEKLAKWNAMLDPMVQDWVKDANAKGLPGAQIIEDIKALRDKYSK